MQKILCAVTEELKKESGARIDISKEPDEEGSQDRHVNITGPPECVEYAKKMVEELLGKSKQGLRVKTEEDDKTAMEVLPEGVLSKFRSKVLVY